MIGVLMSATLPARLGEPSRALIVARRVGRVRDRFPIVLGTLVVADAAEHPRAGRARRGHVPHRRPLPGERGRARGRDDRAGRDARARARRRPGSCAAAGRAASSGCSRPPRSRAARCCACARGLQVFRRPKLGAWAATMQLTAWAIQWLACYVLLVALGLDDQAGLGAAAAVLFAVNVTAAAARHAVEPRRLPGRLRGRAVGLRRGQDERARVRDHPPGGGDRDRASPWACPRWCARA